MSEAHPITIASVTVETYGAPIRRSVRTAFGRMTERPALVVRVVTTDGVEGLGEVWCNFPPGGAAHRAQLVTSVLAPDIIGQGWPDPQSVYMHLTQRPRILALQTGEAGPLAQAIAGIDIALWDVAARHAELPLWRLLGGEGSGRVPLYASGIGPADAVDVALAAKAAGHNRFKIKVGFDDDGDAALIQEVREALGRDATIAVDANQAWSASHASEMIGRLAPFDLMWIEEPIAADCASSEWAQVVAASKVPIAAGENLRGQVAFGRAMADGISVLQPDITKWGGITECAAVAGAVIAAKRRLCPHFLGGGIGLIGSAHLLAAFGGDGLLEFDVNPNPLREGLAGAGLQVDGGELVLTDAPGLGAIPAPAMAALRTRTSTVEA